MRASIFFISKNTGMAHLLPALLVAPNGGLVLCYARCYRDTGAVRIAAKCKQRSDLTTETKRIRSLKRIRRETAK